MSNELKQNETLDVIDGLDEDFFEQMENAKDAPEIYELLIEIENWFISQES